MIDYIRGKILRRKARKLFYQEVIPLSNLLKGGSIDSGDWTIKEKSYWINTENEILDQSHFSMYPLRNDKSNKDDFINNLLKYWHKYNDHEKDIIKPLLIKLFEIKVKNKNKRYENNVSEYTYEMY